MILAAQVQIVDPSSVSMLNGPMIFFWFFSAMVLGGALLTITRSNMIAAVMSMVATFFGLAALYAMLSAHFLAVLQVLVYAGAIMVLFIFVVMVLRTDRIEKWPVRGLFTKIAGLAAVGYVVYEVTRFFDTAVPSTLGTPSAEFGTVANVGEVLFGDYLFAFEAVSLLLLIAVIAAVVVARTHKQELATHEEQRPVAAQESHT